MNEADIASNIAKRLLTDAGKPCTGEPIPIAADGSSRRFWRLAGAIVVAPPVQPTARDKKEAEATWHIGRHLYRKGCATPEIFGFDGESGVLVMADTGSTSLYDTVRSASENKRLELYKEVLRRLIFMQVHGAEDFLPQWCPGAAKYDSGVMLEKESLYFLDAWWQGVMKKEIPDGIPEEFHAVAKSAAEAPADFFQHRDCQSRNITIKDNEPFFIDFQGGLLGAPGYDLASLLIDPYVSLS